ncbi:MAG: TonB-dependent receptor plug domain-containing protein [Bacteroidota bacterium]
MSLVDRYSLDELINLKIVTASRSEQKIEEIPENVEIITAEDIRLYGYRDLDEILQHITGFYKIEDYYWLGSSNYGVRGYFKTGPFSNVAILINGINQVSDKYSDYPDVKITVPVEAIERIEVIKGPMAVLYGNGAFFGVINIITNEKNSVASNKIVGEQSFPNRNRVTAQFSGSGEDFNFKFISSYDYSAGLDVPYTSLTTDTSYLTYVGLDASSTTAGHLDQTRYFSGLSLYYRGFNFDFSYNASNKGVFDGSPVFGSGNNLKTQAVNASVNYGRKIGKHAQLSGTYGFFSHNHILNYELFRKYYYEIDAQSTSAIQGEINLEYSPVERFSLTANLSRRTILDLLQISDFDYYGLNYGDGKAGLPDGDHYSITSLFLQARYRIFKQLSLIAGGRLEHLDDYNMYVARGVVTENPADNRDPGNPLNRYLIESTYYPDNKGFTFVPRLSLIYNPAGKHFIKIMYGAAKKQPSFSENYRQLPESRPALHSSDIKTFELNYYSYAFKGFIINGSFFVNTLENLIENTNIYNPETGEWDFYSTNSGGYFTRGFEFRILHFPVDRVSLDIRGTVQKTTDLREGYQDIKVAYSPNFLGYMNLRFQASSRLFISSDLRYIGKMQTAWVTESTPVAGQRMGESTGNIWLLGVNVLYDKIFGKDIFVSLKFNNLLNTPVRYPVTRSNAWIDKGALGEGFNMALKLGINF